MSGGGVKRLCVGALLLAVAACDGSSNNSSGVEHSAALSESNPLIAYVTVRLDAPARVQIEYEGRGDGASLSAPQPKYRTPLSANAASSHRIPIARLRAETVYRYSVGVERAGGMRFTPGGEFTTGALPDDLRAMQRTAAGRSALPLIFTDYNTAQSNYYIAVDGEGEVVWYFQHRRREPFPNGTLHHIRRNARGNFVYVVFRCCIIEVTPLGEEVRALIGNEADGIPHHDFLFLEDGRILYPAWVTHTFDDAANGGEAEATSRLDTLRIWDPVNGGTEEVWDSRDVWDISDPAERVRFANGWTHLNSLSVAPGGDLILSFRNRNQIIALSPDYQTIRWSLGGPGGQFSFPDKSDQFFFGHTASELANGNILLFDNGLLESDLEIPHIKQQLAGTAVGGRAERYSRALELRLDRAADAAEKVWEYRAAPDIFSPILSSAYRLANGNTLVSFGSTPNAPVIPTAIMEISPAGETLFRLDIVDPNGDDLRFPRRYRAYGDFDSIMGETQAE